MLWSAWVRTNAQTQEVPQAIESCHRRAEPQPVVLASVQFVVTPTAEIPTSHTSQLPRRATFVARLVIGAGLGLACMVGCDARTPTSNVVAPVAPPSVEPEAQAHPGPPSESATIAKTELKAQAEPVDISDATLKELNDAGIVGTRGRGGAPEPVRVELPPKLPAAKGPADERLLFAMRRQFFIASVTDRARALIAIAKATPKDPAIANVHRLCIEAQWAITPGTGWLEGLLVAKDGWTDERTGACTDALMAELKARKAIERSVAGVESLTTLTDRPAYGLRTCHREKQDMLIRRPRPNSPKPLKRPTGVSPGTRSDIIVHIDAEGYSWLAASINAEPGKAARACYAAVEGRWTPPTDTDGAPTEYCRFVRCVF